MRQITFEPRCVYFIMAGFGQLRSISLIRIRRNVQFMNMLQRIFLMTATSTTIPDGGRRTVPEKHSRATLSRTIPWLGLGLGLANGLGGAIRGRTSFPAPTYGPAATPVRRSKVRAKASAREEKAWWQVMVLRIMAVALFGSVPRSVDGGQCVFTQDCFQAGVDTDCIPASTEEGSRSFPLDSAHGFGVPHDKVWDGSIEDPSTGLCERGTPDQQGRCIVDFVAPKGLDPVAPVICPKYEEDGCCSWQQNYALYQNLRLLVDSFGSSTGCLACAVNLVNFWCALVCSPDQRSFVALHDPPYAQRTDDLTGGSGMVLQADVLVDSNLACGIYESCKSVAIVGETTAMQSGLGLLKFQMQTGAIGHGQYFFLSFDSTGTEANIHPQFQNGGSALTLETLSCDSFYHPGSTTVPFPDPPPREDLTYCSCDYCAAACAAGGGVDVDVSNQRPIPVLDGFRFGLVWSVFCAVMVCSVALFWWRQKSSTDTARRMSYSTLVRRSR